MNIYKIEVSERLAKIAEVKAETENEALEIASELYINEEIVLEKDDFVDNDFEIIEVTEERFNKYETICLLKTTAKIEEIENVKVALEKIVRDIKEIENIGIKELAHKIGENENAFYIKAIVNGTKTDIVKLEKYYKRNDNVLKFITVKMED